jgi:hypothetical protein
MKRLLIGSLVVSLVLLMVLSTIPVTVSEEGESSRGSLKTIYNEDFNTNNGGYSGTRSWYWTGSYWYYPRAYGSRIQYVYSPTIDLSKGTKSGEISFRYYQNYPWIMSTWMDISKDNGASWQNIHRSSRTGWNSATYSIADDYLVSTFRLRFGGGHPSYGWWGWTFGLDDVEIKAEVGIPAIVDVDPNTLNLDSMGNWVTVRVMDFPEDPSYDPSMVHDGTVTLEDIGADANGPSGMEDGYYMCKVDRLMLEDSIGAPGEAVELTVNGDVGDTSFEGTNTIRAIHGT